MSAHYFPDVFLILRRLPVRKRVQCPKMLPHCNRGKKTIFAADFPVLLYAGNSNFLLTVRNSCRNSCSNPICVIPVLGYSAWCCQCHPLTRHPTSQYPINY